MEIAVLEKPPAPAKTPEWRNVGPKMLRNEIIPRDRPAVLRGVAANWPIVRAAADSPQALLDYVRARDLGRPARIMVGKPDINGLYFFREDMSGLNFEWHYRPVHEMLAGILACASEAAAPAMYTGATAVEENFPEIGRENRLEILDKPAKPFLWVGNKVTAATHYDNLDGINCMVAGRKRFTFFPPDQLENLYIGPLELGPGGQPTSLVKVAAPDLERYPRFAQALAAAEVAEVGPGDAVYIPNLWWHNVESFEPINLSVNFWWLDAVEWAAEPFAALAHALLAITALPPSRREAWRRMFDHYVFQTHGDPVPYLPADRRGMLGPLTPPLKDHIRMQVIRSLTKLLPQQLGEQIRRLLWAAR